MPTDLPKRTLSQSLRGIDPSALSRTELSELASKYGVKGKRKATIVKNVKALLLKNGMILSWVHSLAH
jgi:hypothetical protein